MFHAIIKEIKPEPNFILKAVFDNGVAKVYDVKKWINKNDAFKPLEEIKGLFELVQIECGGMGIVWNSDIDLDANEIWYNGHEI